MNIGRRIFHNHDATIGLIGALLLEQNCELVLRRFYFTTGIIHLLARDQA